MTRLSPSTGLLPLAALAALAGCGAPTHDLPYFTAHPAEARAVVNHCHETQQKTNECLAAGSAVFRQDPL